MIGLTVLSLASMALASIDPSYMDFALRGDSYAQLPRSDESLQHSSLWGPQYMTGGAGEGNQNLYDGLFQDRQEVKTDAGLPSYCEPPNPCPPGFSAEDGCLEDFENTKDFSKAYQGRQDCMCDEEHMFDCPRQAHAQNNMLGYAGVVARAANKASMAGHHPVVAKKFHPTETRGMKKSDRHFTIVKKG